MNVSKEYSEMSTMIQVLTGMSVEEYSKKILKDFQDEEEVQANQAS